MSRVRISPGDVRRAQAWEHARASRETGASAGLDANDVAALDAAVDPDGELGAIFDRRVNLPAHDWAFAAVLRISDSELQDLVRGQRRRFEFTAGDTGGRLRSSGVFCARCDLTWGQMSEFERQACRGE